MYKAIFSRPVNMRIYLRFSLMALACLILISALVRSASALPEDREQPITLEADSAQYDHVTGKSTYIGNVIVTQGTMRLAAATATVFFQDGDILRMEATGQPTKFHYQASHDKPPIDGVGQKIVYNVPTATVVVTGKASFTQGGDKFNGERIEYDLNKDLVKADGGRIKFVIQPREQKKK